MYIEESSVPVVTTSLKVESEQAGNALKEILATLIKADPQLYCDFTTAEPDIILSGSGEMHLQKTLTKLRTLCPFAIQASALYVPYRELVIYGYEDQIPIWEEARSSKSGRGISGPPNYHVVYRDPLPLLGMTRSPNRANQFVGHAQMLSEALIEDIEKGAILHLSDQECATYLHTKHGWDLNEARKVWSWGPTHSPANCLIDGTKGAAPIPDQVKQDCIFAFKEACQAGPLAEEPLQGVKLVITSAVVAIAERQRGPGQIIPTFRRLILGLVLSSVPNLREATYLLKLTTPPNYVPKVKALLAARRGIDLIPDKPTDELVFFLPVAESFGLAAELQTVTANTARAELTFSHWGSVRGDVFAASSLSGRYVRAIRKRRGLSENIRLADFYLDK